jgi:hypothetical protein
LLLFQEYDFEVIVKPRKCNTRLDHFLRILSGEDAKNMDKSLPDAFFFAIQMVYDYFKDISQFLCTGVAPPEFIVAQKKQLVENLYKLGTNGIL